VPRLRWLLHDDESGEIEIAHQVFGGNSRRQFFGMPETSSPVESQSEGKGSAKIVWICWRKRLDFICHEATLGDPVEQIKNISAVTTCQSGTDSFMLTACQTINFAHWSGSSGKPIKPHPGSRTPSRCWPKSSDW
jgi:hypothetical protein